MEPTNNENANKENEDMHFTGCLAFLNDGVSVGMTYITYMVCCLSIGAGFFITWVNKPLGIPFLVMTTIFSILWVVFIKLYQDENPQSPYYKKPEQDGKTD